MTLIRLGLIVFALVFAIALALSNPTMDDYLRFVERELGRALDKMDQTTPTREQQVIRQIYAARSKDLLESAVRPRTIRQNWGLLSRYKTQVNGTEVLVIGVAGRFIPVKGVDEATLKIGRVAF
jgi:Domain of unknown function (DUF4359)